MIKWASIPFFRFTLAFMSGVLFYLHSPVALPFLYCFIFSVLTFLLLFVFASDKKRFYKLKPFTGLSALLLLFFFGALWTEVRKETNHPLHLIHCKEKIQSYEAIVRESSEERENTFRTILSITKIKRGHEWISAKGNLILYCPKKDFQLLKYGDYILVKGSPSSTQSPANPFEFDYKTYLNYQQIFHIHYASTKDIWWIKNNPPSLWIFSSLSLREKANSILKEYIKGESEYKIASALILGIRSSLDNDLKQAYSSTGTMHVLAVSGLHVGIVLGMLMILFNFLKPFSWGRILLPLLLIGSLWIYAFVTGFSASVLRAVVMFSLIVLAKSMQKNTNIYNTLSLSAFVLLCINPFSLMDAGFQLSYLAVLGIVYFQPKIYRLLSPRHTILDKAWILTSGSIAAQIGTLPICLYYFHQFPLNFIVSNLWAIPISSLVLYSGTLLILFSWIPGFNHLLGWITEKLIWLMNYVIFKIEAMPFSVIKGIDIDLPEVIVLFMMILLLACFFHFKKLVYLKTFTVFLFFFSIGQCIEAINQKNQKAFIAFKIKNHLAYGLIKGRKIKLFADSLLLKDRSKQEYHIYPYLIQHGINEINLSDVKKEKEMIYQNDTLSVISFLGKTFLIEHKILGEDPLKIKVDHYIRQKNKKALEVIF